MKVALNNKISIELFLLKDFIKFNPSSSSFAEQMPKDVCEVQFIKNGLIS